MVKGVSKTIIEVNNTGSKLFEKIVFYVTPEFSNLSAKQLKKAANSFTFNYNLPRSGPTLRKKYRNRNILRIGAISCVLIAAVVTLLVLLL
jgi:hypothetical protein